MKRIDIKYMGLIAGLMMAFSSCADLLNQEPMVDLPATNYWKTESDAESALNGLVSDIRWLLTGITIWMEWESLSECVVILF